MVSVFATQSVPTSYFYGLGFDSSGTLYVADSGTGQIDKINSTGAISPFVSLPSGTSLSGLALDSGNNVYVSDYGSTNKIWKITASGTPSIFATLPSGSIPFGLAFDQSGNLYVANNGSGQIDKITSTGHVSLFATLPNNTRPFGLVFDNIGNLYVADQFNFNLAEIHKITLSGVVSLYTSLGYAPSTITGLACDSSNDLFTGDYNTGNIYKISPGGARTTFATGVNSPTFIAIAAEVLADIVSIARSGNNIVVNFTAVSGRSYRLERKHNLTDPTWESIAGVPDFHAVSNGTAPITDPNAISQGQEFYRVRLLP
jgi:DNA-binding beta-propeller fold protein YncE